MKRHHLILLFLMLSVSAVAQTDRTLTRSYSTVRFVPGSALLQTNPATGAPFQSQGDAFIEAPAGFRPNTAYDGIDQRNSNTYYYSNSTNKPDTTAAPRGELHGSVGISVMAGLGREHPKERASHRTSTSTTPCPWAHADGSPWEDIWITSTGVALTLPPRGSTEPSATRSMTTGPLMSTDRRASPTVAMAILTTEVTIPASMATAIMATTATDTPTVTGTLTDWEPLFAGHRARTLCCRSQWRRTGCHGKITFIREGTTISGEIIKPPRRPG